MTESQWLACDDPAAMLKLLQEWRQCEQPPKVSDRKLRLFTVACCRHIWHLLTDERSRAAVLAAEQFADGLITEDELKAAREAAREAAWAAAWEASWKAAWEASWKAARAAAWAAAWEASWKASWKAAREAAREASWAAARAAAWEASWKAAREAAREAAWAAAWEAAKREQAALLRDIIDNPFRPVRVADDLDDYAGLRQTLTRRHLTPTVLSIANRIYDERDFSGMPVLADALEDAGCNNEEILKHFRGQERCPVCLPWRSGMDALRQTIVDVSRRGARASMTGTIQCDQCEDGWCPLRGTGHVRGCWCLDIILCKE